MGYIYKITNIINNKVYIGQTIGSIEKRLREHKSNALLKKDKSTLHSAMRKYGIENFIIKILEECPNELLNQKEIEYIEKFNSFLGNPNCNGYNMTIGGKGKDNNIYIQIYNLWDAGYSCTQIAEKIKYDRNTIARILKDYDNYSIEESNRRAHTLSGSKKAKAIFQIDLNNNIIKEYNSVAEAERETGIFHGNIIKVANHKKNFKTAGGYRWEYK